jgi:hypothetical protein
MVEDFQNAHARVTNDILNGCCGAVVKAPAP